jgi:hypothetical protein
MKLNYQHKIAELDFTTKVVLLNLTDVYERLH